MTLDQAVSSATMMLPVAESKPADATRIPRTHRPRIYWSRHRRAEVMWTVVTYISVLVVLVSAGTILLLNQ